MKSTFEVRLRSKKLQAGGRVKLPPEALVFLKLSGGDKLALFLDVKKEAVRIEKLAESDGKV